MLKQVCDSFTAQPVGGYKPLACKQPILTMREMQGTGDANKQFFFFLTKPNTIREKATLDLIYPTPRWLQKAINKTVLISRVTVGGFSRVTTSGFLRIVTES